MYNLGHVVLCTEVGLVDKKCNLHLPARHEKKTQNPIRGEKASTALGSDGQGPNGLLSFFWIFSILFDFV